MDAYPLSLSMLILEKQKDYDIYMDNDYSKTTEDLLRMGLNAIAKTREDKRIIRESILSETRESGLTIKTRSEWGAKKAQVSDGDDWNYSAIVLHHAGNSYSCDEDSLNKLRQAEKTDINSFGHLSYHYAIDCLGVIIETLDIREKGAHLKGANTGHIGIVFLSDFSLPGEAGKYGPSRWDSLSEFSGQFKDDWDQSFDLPTIQQKNAIEALVKILIKHFPIKELGGHREFATLNALGRACPGTYGLQIAATLRAKFNLTPPGEK
jgi:hypothetical protein